MELSPRNRVRIRLLLAVDLETNSGNIGLGDIAHAGRSQRPTAANHAAAAADPSWWGTCEEEGQGDKEEVNAGDHMGFDWKWLGVVSALLTGITKAVKFFRAVRLAQRPVQPGVTVHNGEFKVLMETIARIDRRSEHGFNALRAEVSGVKAHLESVDTRLDNLEQRSAT